MTPGTARAAAHAGILEVDRSPPASALAKYAGQPMDFADASVVLLATGVHEILTADRRDFAVHLTSNSTQAPPRFAVMTGAVGERAQRPCRPSRHLQLARFPPRRPPPGQPPW